MSMIANVFNGLDDRTTFCPLRMGGALRMTIYLPSLGSYGTAGAGWEESCSGGEQ